MAQGSFTSLVAGDTPTLVDFHAEWCGPCQMLKPVLEALKQEVGERARIIKIDVDKNPALASQYDVRGVPTLALFRNGELKWRQSGVVPLENLRRVIEQYSG